MTDPICFGQATNTSMLAFGIGKLQHAILSSLQPNSQHLDTGLRHCQTSSCHVALAVVPSSTSPKPHCPAPSNLHTSYSVTPPSPTTATMESTDDATVAPRSWSSQSLFEPLPLIPHDGYSISNVTRLRTLKV